MVFHNPGVFGGSFSAFVLLSPLHWNLFRNTLTGLDAGNGTGPKLAEPRLMGWFSREAVDTGVSVPGTAWVRKGRYRPAPTGRVALVKHRTRRGHRVVLSHI